MDQRMLARDIVMRLREAGHEAYLAGGCVRDSLLGVEPKDFDVATSATPDQVAALFPRVVPVGRAFGVQTVMEGGASVEVATFRADGPYRDGRHPASVSFTTARQDVLRRDFTINGLLGDPSDGSVRDYVGGVADLEARLLRTIGDPGDRFAEDKLRLLRAVRFAARFNLRIEEATWRAMQEHATEIGGVSPERIGREVVLCLTGPRPDAALRLLKDAGLLAVILPEVDALSQVAQSPPGHPEGDAFVHTALLLSHLPPDPPPALALAGLLHDVGKAVTATRDPDGRWRFFGHDKAGARMAADICRRLRYSRELGAAVTRLVADHMVFYGAAQRSRSSLASLLSRPDIDLLLALHRADALASDGDLYHHNFATQRRAEIGRDMANPPPRPLLTGGDLAALGYAPGPRFGRILAAVEEASRQGAIDSPEEARSFVLERFPREEQP